MKDSFICSRCGEAFAEETLSLVGEDLLCENCSDELTGTCYHCGHRIYLEDDHGYESMSLCEHCRNFYYVRCNVCDTLLLQEYAWEHPNGSGDSLCRDCYDDVRDRASAYIHEYHYKPEPIFYGTGNRFYGIELEIDEGGRDSDNAETLYDLANTENDCLYIKTDSSLEDGLELVSHPMTLEYHLASMPWGDVLCEALRLGYYSHKTSTCGLHIHVNRTAFGETEDTQELVIARILYFVEHHWAEMLRFSRRTESQLSQWANRYGYKERSRDILKTAKKGYGGRYTCVNIMNRKTIEFRIFRGTLKHNTFIATLQLVNAICDVALFMSDEQMSNQSWSEFVENLDQETVPELVAYLKERRLYINEPIITEEDN